MREIRVDHERDIDEAPPGGHVGDVGDPQLVRAGRGEVPVHEVGGPVRTVV